MISIGSTVGNYEVISKLGSGAMGVVFLAEHPSIGKRVALKVIHADLAENAEMVSRFFTEARAITQIQNEHVIDVQNFGQTPDGDNFIVMEFLDGRGLGAILKEKRFLETDLAIHICWQVADGLSTAHARGIIHRDLKPDNIFIVPRESDPWFVKILDFGLAKLTQGGGAMSHKTTAGSVLGTPHYMAPEQCEGRADVDHRVDIYALGCILYEMVCGQVPFPGEGFGEVLVKHMREPPMMPTRHNPNLSPAVEKIILHALAKKREYRFQDMIEFRAALTDPERYASALAGDQPMGRSTMELLASSPAVGTHPPVSTDAATQMFEAPAPVVTPPPVRSDARDTVLSMEAPVMPDGPQPTAILDAPKDVPHRLAPAPDPTRRTKAPPAVDETGESDLPKRKSSALIVVAAAAVVAVCAGLAVVLLGRPHSPAPTQVVVNTDPLGATVLRDGKSVGKTPYILDLGAGESAVLGFSKGGFVDATETVTASAAPALTVRLKAREAEGADEAEEKPAAKPAGKPGGDKPAGKPGLGARPVEKPAVKPMPERPAVARPAPARPVAAPPAGHPKKPNKNDPRYDDVMVPKF